MKWEGDFVAIHNNNYVWASNRSIAVPSTVKFFYDINFVEPLLIPKISDFHFKLTIPNMSLISMTKKYAFNEYICTNILTDKKSDLQILFQGKEGTNLFSLNKINVT